MYSNSDLCYCLFQQLFKAMRDQYVKSGQGFLLVYSITTMSSLRELEPIYEQIIKTKVSC